jgi:alpha-tubulin suppressor-like RCC1 family protein
MAIVDDEPQFVPTWLDEFREIEIAMISTGDPWSLALTTQGQVYRFGEADVRYNHSPKLLIGVQDIIAISTSDMSCLLLDAQGRIWAFGCNRNGQLGLGEIERQNTPILIEGLVVG